MKLLSKYKYYILTFFICIVLMLVYQFFWISADRLGGNDSYTHLAKTKLLEEQGITAASYPSILPFTYWSTLNTDNTLVFDYLLLGILWLGGSIALIKVIIATLFGLSSLLFYKILSFAQKNKLIPFIIVLAGSILNIAFFLKFTELRALIFSIDFFFISLGILFIFKTKYYLLIPISFFYTLIHTTVFLIFVPITILLIIDRQNWKKYTLSFVYVLVGIILAMLVFPSANFYQILIIQPIIPFIYKTIPFKIDGAFEVAPDISNPQYLLVSNLINILTLIFGLALYGLFLFKKLKLKIDKFKFGSFILFILFFALDLFSRRFSDYLTPSMFIFLILHLEYGQALFQYIKPTLLKFKYVLIILSLIIFVGFSFVFYNKYLKDNFTNTDYRGDAKSTLPETYGVSNFLNTNLTANSHVYNNSWEDFPYLIYYSPKYKYAAGMELGFMYLYNGEMLRFYQDFRANVGFSDTGSDLIYSRDSISFRKFIVDNFKSNTILVKKGKTEKMSILLLANYTRLGLTKSYEDDFYTVYKI